MRTHTVLSAAIAALALLTASGCCGTQYPNTAPCNPCNPAPAQAVQVVAAQPAQPVQVVVAQPAPAPAATATYVVVSRPDRWHLRRRCTAVVSPCNLCEAGKVVTVAEPVAVAAPVTVVAAQPVAPVKTVTVLRRGRKGRIICYDGKGAGKQIAARLVAATPPAPVVVAAPAPVAPVVVAEPVEVVAPVAAVEPEPVVEEPSWTKYLAPEQPAVTAAAEPYVVLPAPQADAQGRQPIVIQPIIQPIIQTGQEVLSGQVQAPQGVVAAQPLVTFQPAFIAGAQVPVAAPAGSVFAANSLVCGPGQNCFTLPENQLQGGPQVLTPTASAPLVVMQPAVTVASAAPAAAAQDKYGALAPAPEPARQAERPEVSMPAPIGRTTTPPVAGTAEIESALDVMLGNDISPMLK